MSRIALPGARILAWPAALGIGLAAIAGGDQQAGLVARGAAFALGLASLVVLTGWSGQLNLHVAAIGLGWGAYTAGGLATNGVPALVAILVAPLIIAPVAFLVGVVAVRFRGLELAIATLAVGLAFEQMAFQNLGKWLSPDTGGTQFESSLLSFARPSGFEGDQAFALLALAVAAAWLAIAALAGRGRAGRMLSVVRDREVVAEARGVPVFGWRVGAFVLSIAVASAGGAVFAAQSGAVTPGSFGLLLSLQMLAIATLAGIRRLEGALVGAAAMILVQEAQAIPGLSWLAGNNSDLFFGAGLIAVLAWHARATRRAHTGIAVPAEPVDLSVEQVPPVRAFPATVLRVDDLRVRFGARVVLDGASLRVGEGEICGLVGGNGAGKTTLFNCITGLVAPGGGRIFFAGADITEMPPHRRARLGLSRTFQGVEVFEGLTVEEGLMVAAGLRARDRSEATLRARARAALQEVGIASVAGAEPSSLPFATLRLVEIASALVADPALVLLDEPLAGLDAAERARVLHAIRALRAQRRAVLLVEHDHASVEAVADRIYVLEGGRALERAHANGTRAAKKARARKEVRVAAGA